MAQARQTRLTSAEEDHIRQNAHEHQPRLVLAADTQTEGFLDQLADFVSNVIGSMWTFVVVTVAIVVWLFAGNIVGFDQTPWPLLLTILNLPQLSIMISLQVAANRAQKASDARAISAYETLIALQEVNRKQLRILQGQDKILDGQSTILQSLQKAMAGGGAPSSAGSLPAPSAPSDAPSAS
jgi:uncharacterized membrane protein